MKITNPITLDVARSNSYICLLGKQFDSNSRYLQVTLTNNGQPLPISSGASVILRATRADGTAATVAGTVNGDGTATVEIDDYILEAAGNATLSIEVSSAGEVLTSASFNLNVQKADASGWVRVYVAAASLSAGNYYITIGGTSYSFTTTQTIPAGGMIYFASTGGTAQTRDASGNVLDASLTLTEASTGTELTSDVATMSFLDAIAGRVAILEDTDNAVVGSAEALLGGPAQDDAVYTIRASANTARKALRAIKGVTMGWNQIQQSQSISTPGTYNDVVMSNTGSAVHISGTASATIGNIYFSAAGYTSTAPGHVYLLYGCPASGGASKFYIEPLMGAGADWCKGYPKDVGSGVVFKAIKTNDSPDYIYGIRLLINSGTAVDADVNCYLTDLTHDLGPTIADYAYTLESGTPGAGVAWLADNFPELMSKYHAYDTGSLQSTKVSASKASGFNLWDEEWEVGNIDASTGQNTPYSGTMRSKNYIRVLPNSKIYFYCSVTQTGSFPFFAYDENKSYLGTFDVYAQNVFTTPSGCAFIRFRTTGGYGASYRNDICLNLSNLLLNGTYRPHAEHSYPIQPVELRGVLSLDANNKVITTGDEYKSDGAVTRRFGIVDLGDLTWNYDDTTYPGSPYFYSSAISDAKAASVCKSAKYINDTSATASMPDKSCKVTSAKTVYLIDHSFTTAAALTTALSGIYLYYELATPTTETATPFTELQRVDDGIEEFVDAEVEAGTRDVAIPAGTDALVYRDLAALLGAIPNPPTTAGTYTLHATVTSTNATFSWS